MEKSRRFRGGWPKVLDFATEDGDVYILGPVPQENTPYLLNGIGRFCSGIEGINNPYSGRTQVKRGPSLVIASGDKDGKGVSHEGNRNVTDWSDKN